jgi:hypothetical protein
MPGSFTYAPEPVPLARQARLFAVYRYDPDAESDEDEESEEGERRVKYQLLPNVRCVQVQYRDGPDPGRARFRYAFGDIGADPDQDPYRVEHAFGAGPGYDEDGRVFRAHVVQQDDRLVVRHTRDDGSTVLLFDGFAQLPQGDLSGTVEAVTFTALGTPVRCWDEPLGGALTRDADHPEDVHDVPTSLPARFNPDGRPNATPLGADAGGDMTPLGEEPGEGDGDGLKYPTFLGPVGPDATLNGQEVRRWTLGMAARYVIGAGNRMNAHNLDQTFVDLVVVAGVESILVAYEPTSPGAPVDVNDPETFEEKDIDAPDYDVTGECWPDALDRLIRPHGFAMRFALTADEDGDPHWVLRIYREDGTTAVQSLLLQKPGRALDPGLTNVGALSLARDGAQVVNAFRVDSAPVLYEASVVLAPLFDPDPADAASEEARNGFTDPRNTKYRLWGFDECGEGHWNFVTSARVTHEPGDLDPILKGKDDRERRYAIRRRPARRQLVTKDSAGKPLAARLEVSQDYAGPQPGVWDGTGTWQLVHGGWAPLDDRLGIRVTEHDANSWPTGSPAPGQADAFSGKLNLVELCAGPSAVSTHPRFRLTVAVPDDTGLDAGAGRTAATPSRFTVRRRVDGRDRFRKRVLSRWSALADPNGADAVDVVLPEDDDTDKAEAFAAGLRRAHESGEFAGSVTVPRLSFSYRVGDKISGLTGRVLSFRQDVGGGSPVLPTVVGITWDLDGRQATHLELSDRRAEPAPRRMHAEDDYEA